MARGSVGSGGAVVGGVVVAGIAWYWFSKHPGSFSNVLGGIKAVAEKAAAVTVNRPDPPSLYRNGSAPLVDPDSILGAHKWDPFPIDIVIPGRP